MEVGGNRVHSLKHPVRFISIFALVLSAVLLGNGGTAVAANPLLCFSGTTDGGFNGTCTLTASGAILNTNDGDADPNNAYAGVYYAQSTLPGEPLEAASVISFTYAASAGTTASGGSPRVSIGIDENNNGTRESYAFVDTLGCNNGSPNNGTLSFSDTTCTVSYFGPGAPVGGESWVNWAAFAAAHPTWKISENTVDDVPFVVVDQPGLWTVSNVQLGQGEDDEDVAARRDECKKGGWADLTREDGTSFKNQGDCIQYVNTGK
jgi:hypothetical protein